MDRVTPTDTVTYTYGDSEWGDLLTAYDGQALTYDEIGNLTSDGERTYTWKHGRQLASTAIDGNTWTYTYNENGLRTGKTNGILSFSYVYDGTQLSQMDINGGIFHFTYDANGTPLTVTYDGTTYYYVTNLQGDVTAIRTANRQQVVTYTYDAWGNVTTSTTSAYNYLSVMNPLRYRGYVYDAETRLYYLQSRYYNPEWGRFINADDYVATGQGLLGNNMFAYCGNNPVVFSDPAGTLRTYSVQMTDTGGRYPRPHGEATPYQPTPQEKSYAATVYAEAGGENKRSKQAVAHVMNNRIGTRSSWTDIESVISAEGQFNGYNSLMYQEAMNYYDNGICNNPIDKAAMDECLVIVIPIYSGMEADITGGALYFHSYPNPSDWYYHDDFTQIYVSGTEKFWFYK